MKFYNQSLLFQALLSAAERPGWKPEPGILERYKCARYEQAVKALRTRNLFLYSEGLRTSLDLNAVTTIYTKPAGVRLMLIGYSNNLRYGRATTTALAELFFPQEHRIRIVGKNGRTVTEDFVPSQAGIVGEPRYTQIPLTVPVIIEPEEQIAIDLGYDTAADAPLTIPNEAFIFYCLKVTEKMTPQDLESVEDIKRYIRNHDFQRGIYLNCGSPPINNNVIFSTAIAGGVAVCDTRPVTNPLLITGVGTNLGASKLTITDTANGYSFSLAQLMQSSALLFPDFQDTGTDIAAPASGPIWTEYFQLPIPHLLRAGASLRADVVNGNGGQIDPQSACFLMFQCVSV